jgi:hypothetical protein
MSLSTPTHLLLRLSLCLCLRVCDVGVVGPRGLEGGEDGGRGGVDARDGRHGLLTPDHEKSSSIYVTPWQEQSSSYVYI